MSTEVDHLRDLFHGEGRRLTSQRRLVLEALEASVTHLDAEALHDQVKSCDPDISLATVYRTLNVLKEMGLVEEHRLGEGHSHYEAARSSPHYHFICAQCGKVIEFDTPLVGQAAVQLSEREGVQVTDAHLRLSGYCSACRDEPGETPSNDNQLTQSPDRIALSHGAT
jgi:Fe2+ or Zn2+ uptake regulation protein